MAQPIDRAVFPADEPVRSCDRQRLLLLFADPVEPDEALPEALSIPVRYVDPDMTNRPAPLTTEDIDEHLAGALDDEGDPLEITLCFGDDLTGEGADLSIGELAAFLRKRIDREPDSEGGG